MKKVLIMALCFVLGAVITVGGTLAYFTDRESKANVFTVGDVSIELKEGYEQVTELVPGVEISNKPVITNTGENDAWVWLTFSIPSVLDNLAQGTEQGSNENNIHWNPLGATTEGYVTEDRVTNAIAKGYLPEGITAGKILEEKMTWNVFNSISDGVNAYQEKINGVDYNSYVLLYNKAIEPGESTLVNIFKVFLDATIDIDPNGDWYRVNNGTATAIGWNSKTDGNPLIHVSAYAIQKEKFATVEEAYAAYGKQWDANGGAVDTDATQVATSEAFFNAIDTLEDGETLDIVLTKNITADSEILVDAGTVNIDLNGKVIEGTNDRAIKVDGNATLNIKNGTVNSSGDLMGIFGDGKIFAENCSFNAPYCFGMNGSTTNETSFAEFKNCKFNITSGYNAVYVSAKGTYNFKDCVIEGGAGMLIRSGNVTLDGCTVIANGYLGQGKTQTAFYANYDIDAVTDVVKDGVKYWNSNGSEKSTGDCVAIIDNHGDGYDLKSVTIKNCTFEVKNSVVVDGKTVPAAYAVRYLNRGAAADAATLTFANNKDVNGNDIVNGTIGYVYSIYNCNN